MDKPKEGTVLRRLYDYISSSQGVTQHEMTMAMGLRDHVIAVRLAELSEKGLVAKDGQRLSGPDGNLMMDIWKSETPAKKAFQQPVPVKLTPQPCPACGATVYQQLTNLGLPVYVDTQKRLTVLSGGAELYDEHGLPKRPLAVYDDCDGRLCFGREAEDAERTYFKENKGLQFPYTIGYESHLRTCSRWDKWLSGEANQTERVMDLKWDYESKRMEFVKQEPHKFRKENRDLEKKKKNKEA